TPPNQRDGRTTLRPSHPSPSRNRVNAPLAILKRRRGESTRVTAELVEEVGSDPPSSVDKRTALLKPSSHPQGIGGDDVCSNHTLSAAGRCRRSIRRFGQRSRDSQERQRNGSPSRRWDR